MRIVAGVLLIAMAWAGAQGSDTSPSLSGIAHVAMRVSNLEASRAFYKKLGVEEAFAFDSGGSPSEAFFKVNDTQFIELYPRREAGQAVGFLHVCFQSQDLQALNEFYRGRGLAPTAVSRGGAGNLLFSLSGPGLENIEFTQYMPGSRHTNDIGKHLGEHRVGRRIVSVEFPTNDMQGAVSFYAKMGLRQMKDEKEFLVTGDGLQLIHIGPADSHLTLVMEAKDLKQSERELRRAKVRITYGPGSIVVHDPDGNAIVLEALLGSAGTRSSH